MSFSELKFKKYVRKSFDGWSEAYEPGRGGGTGIPDLQLLVKHRLLPVELKVDGGALNPKQNLWHANFYKVGGFAAILDGSREKRGAPVVLRIRRWDGEWEDIHLPLRMFLNQWVPW